MSNYIDRECPSCKTTIEMYAPRWNSMTICPSCNKELLVHYDCIVMEPDCEEWDLHDLEILSESIYSSKESQRFLDEIESKIYNDESSFE